MRNIAIFASGSGSNAENIVRYFKNHPLINISMMVSDRKNAFVFERMKALNVPSHFMSKEDFSNGNLMKLLFEHKIDFVVLAGFLKLMPSEIIKNYPKKIVNIHPALLPSYGGKGMYGKHVHEAIIRAGESKSGITIHYVDEYFDEGEIICQYQTAIEKSDTPESVAAKIHELEMRYYPLIIEKVIME